FVLHNKNKYPVRQAGIKDFFDILTTRASWPVRSSSTSSHSRFGLDETPDRRVTFYGENNVLLDILVNAAMGREVFLRQYGQNEVRSGENRIVSFITSSADNWFNLRLIPESESGKIDAGSVQRFSVYDKDESLIFSRRNRGWIVSSGETVIEDINSTGIENYLQTILNSQGDSFVDSVFSDDPAFNYSRIILELGTGKIITIRFTAPYENNYRLAHVSDSGYIYSIPMWVSNQVFRSLSSFERQ
ncbi:MAG: DUF4340 domain-containing protein, partial [Treponema sp.]|nr:DUF4340 domain-containing protein [Treponema sp.]